MRVPGARLRFLQARMPGMRGHRPTWRRKEETSVTTALLALLMPVLELLEVLAKLVLAQF